MSQPAPKKAKYSQKYPESGCLSYAYCTYCLKDFRIAIASSGKFDVSRHKSGPSHVSCEKNQRKMW